MIEIAEGVYPVSHCAVRCVAQPWPFAVERQSEITRHWQKRLGENPKFFNGGVYIMTSASFADGGLTGSIVETDFASSLYWRETGFEDHSVVDCFAPAIILCADGGLVYGRQSAGNVNAGLAYPPSGFLDARDITENGEADLAGSAARELQEEIGGAVCVLPRDPGYLLVRQGPYLCVGVVYRSPLPSEAFVAAAQQIAKADDELEALVALRCKADISRHSMRDYAKYIAEYLLEA